MTLNPFWFVSYAEANDWLDFECSDADAEFAFYSEPDHYSEWQQWQASWESNGYPDFNAVIVDAGGQRV